MWACARVRIEVSAGFVLGAGAKAKSVTSLLTLPSVLAAAFILFSSYCWYFSPVGFSVNLKNGTCERISITPDEARPE